jgi:drug/metabolite transporter (DMT)-like permease
MADQGVRGWLPWLLLFALAVVWGSSFILMKRGLEVFTAGQVAAMRISIASVCLLPLVLKQLKFIEPKQWKYLIAVGFLGNGIPAFLFAIAQTRINSSLAGILNALTPLLTLVIALTIFKVRLTSSSKTGVLIGFAGATLLLLVSGNGSLKVFEPFGLLVVAATLCYAFSVNIIRQYLHSINSLLIAGSALLVVGILCAGYLLTTDIFYRINGSSESLTALGYVITLSVFGTAISLIYFNDLIKIAGPVFATSVTYLIPVVAVIWGTLDGEFLQPLHFLGLAGILSGVYMVNRK